MARQHVVPTKTNLFKVRHEESFALEGHRLLEQKRDILVAELLGLIGKAAGARKDVDEALREAFMALGEAVVRTGRARVRAAAQAVNLSADITVRRREVIGVHLPVIEVAVEDHSPYYSLRETSLWLDEASLAFRRVLKLLGRMAELKVSLVRIAGEVRKTVRRVNALERIYLPDYKDTIKYIDDALEEQGREAFFVLKRIKTRIDRKSHR